MSPGDAQPAVTQSPDTVLRDYVDHVPLYHAAAGRAITAAGLLASLPYITKQEIKRDFPNNFLRAGQSLEGLVAANQVEIEHTAGTTDNRADLILGCGWWARQEQWALGLNQHIAKVLGENPAAHRVTISSPACNGDITYNGTPSAKRRTIGTTRVLSLSRFPFLLSADDLDQMVHEALDWDPVFLDTDPVYAAVFALHCERRQVRFPRLQFIMTSYEYTSVLHQGILKRAFGVPVYNLYGSTETGHLMMECTDERIVPSPKVALLDVINVDSRGIGELVVSTLTNDYMPLLNYRIGDLVERRLAPDGPSSPVSYLLHGRAADALLASDGDRVTTRDVDQCFAGSEGLLHYRLHEVEPGHFHLHYISDGGDGAQAVRNVVPRLQQLLKLTRPIETQAVRYLLPENSGKFVFNYPFVS